MKPIRTLDINRCKKCGSSHVVFDYYYKAMITKDYHFLWEKDGYFIRPRCADCDNEPQFRWFDTIESAVVFWNEEI